MLRCLPLLLLLLIPGVSSAEAWWQPRAAVPLHRTPDRSATVLGRLPARDVQGLPVAVADHAHLQLLEARWWLQAPQGPGWVQRQQLRRMPEQLPSAALRGRLRRLLRAAGPNGGGWIGDAQGRPWASWQPAQPRLLASNAKLFVTAAALQQLGGRVRRELPRILLPSDNRRAERLAWRLGDHRHLRGVQRTRAFAARWGARVWLADGSGLSRRNWGSPQAVAGFLVGLRRWSWWPSWAGALPLLGRSGTLRLRLRDSAAAGHCRAKTGTLHDVSTLSGYCRTLSGRDVVFSLLFNRTEPERAHQRQDRLLRLLVLQG